MAVGITLIFIGDQVYDEENVFNLYFKKKKNQIGRFEFDIHGTYYDSDIIKERAYIRISVNDKGMFDGYITKIQEVQTRNIYHIEGESIEGILATKTTGIPVTLLQEGGKTEYGVYPPITRDSKSYAHAFLSNILFRSAKLEYTDWKLIGDSGSHIFFYRCEPRAVIDHLNSLSKISGYDWECYLDV